MKEKEIDSNHSQNKEAALFGQLLHFLRDLLRQPLKKKFSFINQ